MNHPAFSSEPPSRAGRGADNGEFYSSPRPSLRPTPVVRPVNQMRRMRILGVLGLFLAWAIIIIGRLIWLQGIRHGEWAERAARQQERTFKVAPRRGILYDRNLHALAMTVLADSIYAVPTEIGSEENKEKIAAALAKVVHTDPEDRFTSEQQILARLRASRNFAWVARKRSPQVIAQVKALNLKGVYFQKEFKRFYPDQQLAAQVLGYVGMDDDGLAGIEQKDDKELHGAPGHMLTAIDARRHVLDSEERQPLPGENLVLSIDGNIQFMAEQALDRNMERTGAANGTVVVQDPHTGQILALAIRPTFNPNDFRHTDPSLLRDHAVSDVYEPGSTFKLVTYSAALEEHVATPDSMVDCQGGSIVVAGRRTVHDAPGEHYHNIPVWQALAVSSDVAAIKLAERMGEDRFYHYIQDYGFGKKTGIELPGETRGLVKPVSRWQPTTIGSIPMGQEIAVTPIQLVSMVSTIANGGMYLPPHIVLESTDETKASGQLKPATFHPENEVVQPTPKGSHRVISEMTAAEMRQMMEDVVLYGTGKPAQLDGYSSAGKTGTAQKIDPRTHTYSKTKYVASFVGFAPVNNPAVTIVIVMDSPTKGSHFGTSVSAPVFHDLAQQILEYLGVPHDQELKPQKEIAKNLKAVPNEPVPESTEDLQSLFAEVNNLPADDPLRNPQVTAPPTDAVASASAPPEQGDIQTAAVKSDAASLKVAPAPHPAAAIPVEQVASAPVQPLPIPVKTASGAVAVPNQRVAVPSFEGKSLRQVVVQASGAGLGVQVVGSGIARQQAPAAGTLVPAGTEVVVRFTP